MHPKHRIPSGADELRGLSPGEWFTLKNRIVREARLAQAAAIRAAFVQVAAATARRMRAARALMQPLFACVAAVRTHKAIHH